MDSGPPSDEVVVTVNGGNVGDCRLRVIDVTVESSGNASERRTQGKRGGSSPLAPEASTHERLDRHQEADTVIPSIRFFVYLAST